MLHAVERHHQNVLREHRVGSAAHPLLCQKNQMIHCWRGSTQNLHDVGTAQVKPVSQPAAVGIDSTSGTTTCPEVPRRLRIIGLELAQVGVSAIRLVVQGTYRKNQMPKHRTAVM